MFDNSSPYTLWTKNIAGVTRYYISFKDGQGERQKTEVEKSVYDTFLQFEKKERNLRRSDERHIEQLDLSEIEIYNRAVHVPKSLEEWAIDAERNERLWLAIADLPEVQRRRFVMYHEDGLSFEEIGEREGCSGRAAQYSVRLAKEKIRERMKNFEN